MLIAMQVVTEVDVQPGRVDRFRELMSEERFDAFQQTGRRAAERLRGVTMWNLNSTARGGGVAEMLRCLLGYARGAGVDARWLTVEGEPDFFEVTKRIHNRLHGSPGDGGGLDDAARASYERVLAAAAADLEGLVRPGDVVVLHDPQMAGLLPTVRRLGARAIWRCHVGTEVPSELADEAWAFLQPYLAEAEVYVFSCRTFAWRDLDAGRVRVIAPSIDAFSAKNRALDEAAVGAILAASGVVPSMPSPNGGVAITTRARMVEDVPVPAGVPVVTQVSRWDRLKDPAGVIEGFATHVAPFTDAHLVLAGPSNESVADDPEGAEVLEECVAVRSALPARVRPRVHLACLPMADADENALMVNALQRHADVVVQKSLAEGFGLTVAEAMWKARPLVAGRVGGIQEQIEHGRTGLLVDEPADLAAFGAAVRTLLEQRERAAALGLAGREAVRRRFLAPRHLGEYAELVTALMDGAAEPATR